MLQPDIGIEFLHTVLCTFVWFLRGEFLEQWRSSFVLENFLYSNDPNGRVILWGEIRCLSLLEVKESSCIPWRPFQSFFSCSYLNFGLEEMFIAQLCRYRDANECVVYLIILRVVWSNHFLILFWIWKILKRAYETKLPTITGLN